MSLKAERDNCRDLGVKKETIDLVLEGMERACAPGGTGWPLFNFKIYKSTNLQMENSEASQTASKQAVAVPVACKTGTAEFGDPKNRTHAWFTAFAPIPDRFIPDEVKKSENYIDGEPEISVTVLVEGAGEGSSVAAPVAKKIFEEWFGR